MRDMGSKIYNKIYNKNFKIILVLILIIFCISVVSIICYFNFSKVNKNLEVTFFDIGQGDSIFIKLPTGQNILIDGGPDNAILNSLSKELSFFDRKIDLIILTHPHDDHLGGLVNVLQRFEVDAILSTGVKYPNLLYDEWNNLIKQLKIKQIVIENPQKIIINNDIYFNILFPLHSIKNKGVSNLNNTSIVIKFVYGKNSFLFTGDIEKETENELIENNINLKAKILKVAHHGSDTSSQINFLQYVDPLYAVIQAGIDNKFNFPHRRVLNKLKKQNIFVYRNDLDGDVKFKCNKIYCKLNK